LSQKKLAKKPRTLRDAVPLIEQYVSKLDLADDVYRHTSGMIIDGNAKYVTWDFPTSLKTLELIQITDVQFGNKYCKVDRVREFRDWVLDAPNRFMIWTGDMVDAWAMWSPGTAFEQIGDPQSQIFQFAEMWAPARHRILGYVGGNHERRAIPGFGDLGVLLAALLAIPYSRGRQLIDVHYGTHKPFKISQWHGKGGARTKGTVAQNLHRYASDGDSQLYLMGHLHQPLILPFWKEKRGVGQKVVSTKCIAALGSSFLETWGTYGEVAGYSGHDVLMPCAQIEPNGKWQLNLR
jgi:hypothetical protein